MTTVSRHTIARSGAATRSPNSKAAVKEAVLRHLRELQAKPRDTLLAERSRRLAGFGAFTEGSG